MMRPMFLEFPEDLTCETLDRQYMLGDSLMVAPIFKESGEVSYYLPEGIWTNYGRDGATVDVIAENGEIKVSVKGGKGWKAEEAVDSGREIVLS